MPAVSHLDADAFFASVEQAADPRLRGRPVAVGGERRGIVASASYEARRFGIYTPMPTARARKLCPRLIVLPGDFEKYERFSRWMFSYAYDFTPDVEVTSIDEGYIDLSAVRKPPLEVAATLRDAIRQALKITVSEGIGANKLVSQIASKFRKPAAFVHVPSGEEIPFLHPLPNKWLPGVGPHTAARLNAAGLPLIQHVAGVPLDLLSLLVGRAAPRLKEFANGIDERPVVPASEPAKSYGQQRTFDEDQTDEAFLEAVLRRMADRLFAKVRADGKSVRTLTVKVRYNDMDEDQCSESLVEPTDLETDVYGRLHTLLRKAWKRRVSLRLVSLRLSNLYEGAFGTELPLDRAAVQQEARRRLAGVVDTLREEHGRYVVMRGHDLLLRETNSSPASETQSRRSHRRPRPQSRPVAVPTVRPTPPRPARPVPLGVRSHFSFLDSTLAPREIVALAKAQGLETVALCDTGNLHGAPAFAAAAKAAGIRPVFGAEIQVHGRPLRLYVQSRTGYANLCRLLSPSPEGPAGRSSPGEQELARRLAAEGATEGLLAVGTDPALAGRFPERFHLGVSHPDERRRLRNPDGLPLVAWETVHYARPEARWQWDILQSIRTLTLLRQAHPDKRLDGAFHFRSAAEWAARFRECPELLARSAEIAARCADFEFPFGKPQFPAFAPPDGSDGRTFLCRLVLAGMRRRYGDHPNARLAAQIQEELAIIHDVGYEDYFLIVWDLLRACRERGIDWITRGSAADSLVCYCLGISDVCPVRFNLYFRRFLNRERMALHKLPDIDIDFPHDRKDDVVDLLFEKYGPEHCAVVGGFSTFRTRSAFAEVAKVLGVAEREVRRFTEHFPWSFGGGWETGNPESDDGKPNEGEGESRLIRLLRAAPETRDLPLDEEPWRGALFMAELLEGRPRYPKMHPCGVVLSRQPMHELTPTFISQKGWPTTQFDMNAVEAIGLVKMDILAQGGLATMRDTRRELAKRGLSVDLNRFTVTRSAEPRPADAASA